MLSVVAGIVASNAIYFALAVGVLMPIQRASGDSPESWLGVAFYLFAPIGQLAGGLLTGYICRTMPPVTWRAAILQAPGLYTFSAIVAVPSWPSYSDPIEVFMLGAGLIWISISTVGVFLGSRWRR